MLFRVPEPVQRRVPAPPLAPAVDLLEYHHERLLKVQDLKHLLKPAREGTLDLVAVQKDLEVDRQVDPDRYVVTKYERLFKSLALSLISRRNIVPLLIDNCGCI